MYSSNGLRFDMLAGGGIVEDRYGFQVDSSVCAVWRIQQLRELALLGKLARAHYIFGRLASRARVPQLASTNPS